MDAIKENQKKQQGDISKVKSKAILAPADAAFALLTIFRQKYHLRKFWTSPGENEYSPFSLFISHNKAGETGGSSTPRRRP